MEYDIKKLRYSAVYRLLSSNSIYTAHIIRKTKCFDFWERNVLFPKTKRFFFAPLNTPYPALFRLISHF